MLLTAQRVRTQGGTREGINVFLFSHASMASAALKALSTDAIVEKTPGTLMLEVIAIPPGMNDVTSYLDVVSPDQVLATELAHALEAAATRYPALGSMPALWEQGDLRLRFLANASCHPDAPTEFRRLNDKLRSVLASGLANPSPLRPGVARAPNPLRVLVRPDGEGRRYALDEESRRLLRRVRPDLPLAASLGVSSEHVDTLNHLYGSGASHAQFAAALTGLSIEALKALAGVSFLDETGRLLWSTETR
jgi:hypothetical protein